MSHLGSPVRHGDVTSHESDIKTHIHAALIHQLYSQVRVGIYSASTGAIILAGLVWHEESHYLVIGWLAAFVATQILRHLLIRNYLRKQPAESETAPWGRWLILSSVATAFLWGCSGIILFEAHNFFRQGVLAIVLASVAASTAVAHAPLTECYVSSVVFTLGPFLGRLAWQGDEHSILLAVGGIAFLGSVLWTGRSIHAMIVDTIRLRWEKDALVKALTEAHDTLESRVEERTAQLAEMNAELQSEIEERRRTEETLKQEKEKFEVLAENLPLGLVTVSKEGDVLYTNQKFVELFGYSPPKHLHFQNKQLFKPDGTFFSSEDLPLSQAVLQGKICRNVEAIITKVTGVKRWVLVNAAPVVNQEGNIVAGIVIFTDITERKKGEDELRASETKYRTILETIADGYHETDIAGNLTLVNDSLCEIVGYRREELIGMNYRTLIDPSNTERVYEAYNKVYRTGNTSRDFTFEIVRKDRSRRNVSASISPITDPSGSVIGFRGILRDTTEVMMLEQQLRHAVKMEAIGRLAGGVAHDFNNLLTAMIGYSDLLARELSANASHMEKVLGIRKAAQSAAALTQQLLAFSRKQVLDVSVIDINELIARLESMLRRLIGEDVEFTITYGSSPGFVRADPGQLEQVLVNLVVNSRDALPEGGCLTIETSNEFLDHHYAASHAEVKSGPYVMIAVSDNGTGIEPELLSRVFDPFFTTKKLGAGTGLGLSTVYGIVKQHMGHVAVYSEKGKGTTFKVYLPQIDAGIEHRPLTTVQQEVRGGIETLLVVEDEDTVRGLISEVLEGLGYKVMSVGSPNEAIETSNGHSGTIHLLLTDVVLPQMDGKSLFELLAPSRPGMKVLFVSGYTENFIVRHGVLDPGIHFLQKPFTVEDLARKVREALKA